MSLTTAEKVLGVSVLLGLLSATVITFQHLFKGPNRSYDNWLLPVFLAVALQLYMSAKSK